MFAQLDIDNDVFFNDINAYMVMNVHDKLSKSCRV